MITMSYGGSATTCNMLSVVWEDPKRKWIVIKASSYPAECMRKRLFSSSAVDIACPDSIEGEVQYNSCKNPKTITDKDVTDLDKVLSENWPKDDEPLAEFVVKEYKEKVKL